MTWQIEYLGGIKTMTSQMPWDCDQCTDPITTLSIDSHFSGEVVTNSPIQLTGTVNGGVDHISVMVNGNTYNATINGNVWSATVPLVQ
ncbi:MAG: hypothetical protein H6765_09375 [Candidatus Peribacteria bacterium]|nr:MAG: hypothetical protein H6765_09375 [Candidatus Peribacteria bacterium]